MSVAKTGSGTSRRLKKTGRIFIESGILYTVSGALNLTFQASNMHNKYSYIACIVDIIVCFPLSSFLRCSALHSPSEPFRDWNYIQPHHNAYWARAIQPQKRFRGLTIYCRRAVCIEVIYSRNHWQDWKYFSILVMRYYLPVESVGIRSSQADAQ
jgi:hypothetical protein